jgi:hypothetical protein
MILDPTNKVQIIAHLVEKTMKGVRKQMRGYVREIKEEIEWSKVRITSSIKDFEELLKISKDIRKDWAAVESMLREHEQHKKLMFEMRELHEELRNELMDMKLLNIEMKQHLKGRSL